MKSRVVGGCAVSLAWLAVIFTLPVFVRPALGDRLAQNPHEQAFWGALPTVTILVAWWVAVVGYVITAKVDSKALLPRAVRGKGMRAFGLAAGVLASLGAVLFFSEYSRHGRDLSDYFPDLPGATFGLGLVGFAASALTWWLVAVLPAWLQYRRRKGDPTLVDGELHLGTGNTLRVLYRPTFGLGRVLRLRVADGGEFTIGPGQALGVHASDGLLELEFLAEFAIVQKPMAAYLDLAAGSSTEVTVSSGARPRVRGRVVPHVATLTVASKPFVSRWTGPGSVGGSLRDSRPASRIFVSEAAGGTPARDPWWSQRRSALLLVAACIIAFAVAGLISREVNFDDPPPAAQVASAAGLPVAAAAWLLDSLRRRLMIAPWRAPAPVVLAALLGLLPWVTVGPAAFGLVTAIATGLVLTIALIVLGKRTSMRSTDRRQYWVPQADAVRRLKHAGPRSGGVASLKVTPVTRLRGASVDIQGLWSERLDIDPVGVTLAPGRYDVRVTRGGGEPVTSVVELAAGQLTELRVGAVPLGLQWRRPRGRLRIVARPHFNAALRRDTTLPSEKFAPDEE